MFNVLASLTKATVGAVVKTPVSIVTDVITMGGALTDKEKPYTAEALQEILENINDATNPKK